MTGPAAVVLLVMICGPRDLAEDAPLDACEEWRIYAPSCRAALALARDGLRPGQQLYLSGCSARRDPP